jgi:hypothetical protein
MTGLRAALHITIEASAAAHTHSLLRRPIDDLAFTLPEGGAVSLKESGVEGEGVLGPEGTRTLPTTLGELMRHLDLRAKARGF